jgi:hypothetical protein
MRSSLGRSLAIVAFCGLALSACGDEPADEESFFQAMTEQAGLTTEEANCMVEEIFVNAGLTEAEINEGADDIDNSTAFRTAFLAALDVCTDLPD